MKKLSIICLISLSLLVAMEPPGVVTPLGVTTLEREQAFHPARPTTPEPSADRAGTPLNPVKPATTKATGVEAPAGNNSAKKHNPSSNMTDVERETWCRSPGVLHDDTLKRKKG